RVELTFDIVGTRGTELGLGVGRVVQTHQRLLADLLVWRPSLIDALKRIELGAVALLLAAAQRAFRRGLGGGQSLARRGVGVELLGAGAGERVIGLDAVKDVFAQAEQSACGYVGDAT